MRVSVQRWTPFEYTRAAQKVMAFPPVHSTQFRIILYMRYKHARLYKTVRIRSKMIENCSYFCETFGTGAPAYYTHTVPSFFRRENSSIITFVGLLYIHQQSVRPRCGRLTCDDVMGVDCCAAAYSIYSLALPWIWRGAACFLPLPSWRLFIMYVINIGTWAHGELDATLLRRSLPKMIRCTYHSSPMCRSGMDARHALHFMNPFRVLWCDSYFQNDNTNLVQSWVISYGSCLGWRHLNSLRYDKMCTNETRLDGSPDCARKSSSLLFGN